MGALSKVLRSQDGDRVAFMCPGCQLSHWIRIAGPNAWTWDGNVEAPTFAPSIEREWFHWVPPATQQNPNPGPQMQVTDICHSFVRAGKIQFFNDCTHALAGQTVPLPEWSDDGK